MKIAIGRLDGKGIRSGEFFKLEREVEGYSFTDFEYQYTTEGLPMMLVFKIEERNFFKLLKTISELAPYYAVRMEV